MKRILFLTTIADSAYVVYRGYLRYLREQGWDVRVASASDGSLERWAASEGARGYALPLVRQISLAADIRGLIAIMGLIRRLRPDVVVSATPKAGLLGTVAAWINRVPVRVYDVWGLRMETEHGMKRHVLGWSERVAMAAATDVYANSESLRRMCHALGLSGRKSVKVVGSGSSYGVDCEYFGRDCVDDIPPEVADFLGDAPPDRLVVGFVGRLTKDKGIDTLLDATQRCLDQGVSLRLILVGATEDERIVERVDVFCARGVALRVGHVDDVRGYLKVMDVLCLPSLREGFPNVVLEAAAMEVPAIVSDATGAVDSVVDGETGWIVPVGDAGQLAQMLRRLADDPVRRTAIGGNAREWVCRSFDRKQLWGSRLAEMGWTVGESRTARAGSA
ncbi:MAG: glycosyltransferase family 4 protein [Propionibacteriaceae bacterium]|jgi:glycosyltransferase involved in cell wall biosynthesis|nr:glycosyltransferase family 4 protein [Propionibacteriaceae bacterium]